MFLDFLPIKFSHLGTVNFNEKAEWSFVDTISWQEHNQTRKRLIFSRFFKCHKKEDKRKNKWQKKQNHCAGSVFYLYVDLIHQKNLCLLTLEICMIGLKVMRS